MASVDQVGTYEEMIAFAIEQTKRDVQPNDPVAAELILTTIEAIRTDPEAMQLWIQKMKADGY